MRYHLARSFFSGIFHLLLKFIVDGILIDRRASFTMAWPGLVKIDEVIAVEMAPRGAGTANIAFRQTRASLLIRIHAPPSISNAIFGTYILEYPNP